MRTLTRSLRNGLVPFLAIWAMAVWLGGFTFYSTVVIPVLHDQLGSPLETGLVTQDVTDWLNLLGVAAITLAGLGAILEPSGPHSRFRSGLALGLLASTAICLAALFVLHHQLDRKLESGELTRFYPLHRVYLWISTIQWLANTALLATWSRSGRSSLTGTRQENSQVSEHP